MLFTYLCFFIGFGLDLNQISSGLRVQERYFTSDYCSLLDIDFRSEDTGCLLRKSLEKNLSFISSNNNSYNYFAYAQEFHNVISFSFVSQQHNQSTFIQSDTCNVNYDLSVFACYDSFDCNIYDLASWYHVISIYEQFDYDNFQKGIQNYMLGTTFQNQESLPNQGEVYRYLVRLEYHFDEMYSSTEQQDISTLCLNLQNIEYYFKYIDRPSFETSQYLLPVAFFLTCICFHQYYYKLKLSNGSILNSLPEQRYVIILFVAILCSQNLFFMIAYVTIDPDHILIYACYIVDNIASALSLFVWLLFADTTHNSLLDKKKELTLKTMKVKEKNIKFFVPKLLIVSVYLICNIIANTMLFPSVSENDGLNKRNSKTTRSPVESVGGWPNTERLLLLYSFSIGVAALFIWGILWVYYLHRSNDYLKHIPYMTSRYKQLSFRYITFFSKLLIVYYILITIVVNKYTFTITSNSNSNDNTHHFILNTVENMGVSI